MKKKILSFALSMLLFASGISVVEAKDNEVIVHVSVNGSDSASGTEDKPLQTLEGAKAKVRKIRKENEDASIRVIFHEGEYRFTKTVSFDKNDSGTEENPVVYEGAEGEKVQFKGSTKLDISKLKPVSDKNVKRKLKSSIADYVGEINLRDFGINSVDKFLISTWTEPGKEYVSLFLNNTEQSLAQYPNGFGNYSQWDYVIDPGSTSPGGAGGTFVVTDEEATRWGEAKDFWIGGYPSLDYRYARVNGKSVDTDKKAITLASGISECNFSNIESKRWKIFNILEELDSPGEWFIDRDTLMLYYYAPYNVKNAELELATFSDAFVTMSETNYVEFKNIEFSQSIGTGIHLNPNTNYISITDCDFKGIGRSAIRTQGSAKGTFEPYYNFLDAPSNIVIDGCDFYNIGSSAVIMLGGGNRQTLTSSGNIIRNCNIEKVNQKNLCIAAVTLQGGMNIVVENNLFSTIPFHAINFFGNDHVIRYNEFTDCCMEATDAAVLYSGRSLIMRGCEISYNYIHNYRKKGEYMKLDQVPGVYLDDSVAGTNIHHNIFQSGGIGVMINKGQDTKVTDNIMVDVSRPISWVAGGDATSMMADLENALTYPGWAEKYPMLLETQKSPHSSIRCDVVGNVTDTDIMAEATIIERNNVDNNIVYKDKDIYVNPENNDYRLKGDSEISKEFEEVLSENNFDLSKLGPQKESKKEIVKGDFKKLYPQNGAYDVNSANIEFKWEDAPGAEEYRLVVAKDPELKDIVVDKVSYYTHINVTELESGTTPYYYTVFAKKTYGGVEYWEGSEARFRFTTSVYGGVNLNELKDTVKYTESILSGIREGNEPGLYKEGTKDTINELLVSAKEMLKWESEKDGSQSEIDKVNNALTKAVSEENIYNGYLGVDNMVTDLENWVPSTDEFREKGIISDGDTLSIIGENTNGGVAMYKETQSTLASRNTVRKFQMKCDVSSGWIGMGLRTVDHDKAQVLYTASNPCYFFAIKSHVIEFQINPGGIILEIPNTYIKDGVWHEIEFGVLNNDGVPVVILNVDGEEVLKYYDDTHIVKTDAGGMSFSVGNNKGVSIRPTKEKDKEFPYNDLIKSKETSDYMVYTVDSSDVYIGESKNETENKPFSKDNTVYIPLRFTAENLGYKVLWNKDGYAQISFGDNTVKIYPNENKITLNDSEKNKKASVLMKNGTIMLSVEDLAEILDLKQACYDDKFVVIGTNFEDEETQKTIKNLIGKGE